MNHPYAPYVSHPTVSPDEQLVRAHRFYAIALWDFDADASEPDQLSFSSGDILSIIGDGANGWLEAVIPRSVHGGWVPARFLQRVTAKEAEAWGQQQQAQLDAQSFLFRSDDPYDDDVDTISVDRLSFVSVATRGSEPGERASLYTLPSISQAHTAGESSGSGSPPPSPNVYLSDSISPRSYSSFQTTNSAGTSSSRPSSSTSYEAPTPPPPHKQLAPPIVAPISSTGRPSLSVYTPSVWSLGGPDTSDRSSGSSGSTIGPSSSTLSRSDSLSLSLAGAPSWDPSAPGPPPVQRPSGRVIPSLVIPAAVREASLRGAASGAVSIYSNDGSGPSSQSPTTQIGFDTSGPNFPGPSRGRVPLYHNGTGSSHSILSGTSASPGNAHGLSFGPGLSEGTPWYLKPSYKPTDLLVDENGHIQAGTLEALTEQLTLDPSRMSLETAFRDTFFTTYLTFATGENVVDILTRRYETDTPVGLTDPEFEDWKNNKLRITQNKVLTAINTWLINHHMVEVDPEVVPRVTEFLGLIKTPANNAKKALFLQDAIAHRVQLYDKLPSPSIISPTGHRKKKLMGGLRRKNPKFDILKFDYGEFASTLTSIEAQLYSRIYAAEMLKWSKTQDKNDTSMKNLNSLCNHGTRITNMFKYIILMTESLAKRRSLLEFLIRVDDRCRALNNFSSVNAITNALSAGCIDRLTHTWTHVDRGQRLEGLKQLAKPINGYAAYRAAYKTVEGPCIPYVPMFLVEMNHVNEGHPDMWPMESEVPRDPLINFDKRRRMAEVCQNALRFQRRQYQSSDISENSEILQFIEEQLDLANALDEDWFWNRANEVQKGEEEGSDIRRGLEAAGF